MNNADITSLIHQALAAGTVHDTAQQQHAFAAGEPLIPGSGGNGG